MLVQTCPVQYLAHTRIKNLFIVYLKVKFNGVCCILRGNPTLIPLCPYVMSSLKIEPWLPVS